MSIDNENSIPLCSVCCLSYKHADFIEQNIKSIWGQTYKNIEIIALDDGSPDNSVEVLEKLQKQSSLPMHIITQENTGNIAKNFNILLANATGKYILFISCDDKLVEDTIESKIVLMEDNNDLVLVASKRYYEIDNEDNLIKKGHLNYLNKKIETVDDLLELEYSNFGTFYIQGAIFRKSIIDAVAGYDEDLLGDDIVIRTKIFLYMKKHLELTFKFIDNYGFYYRIHDSNIHKNIYRQIKLVLQVLDRYFPERKIPKILKDWIGYGFSVLPLKDAMQIFYINQKSFDLLLDKDIQKIIFDANENAYLPKYVFGIYMIKTDRDVRIYLSIFDKRFLLLKQNKKGKTFTMIKKIISITRKHIRNPFRSRRA